MIRLKVPQLLKERGMSASDLMRQADVAYVTALRLAKGNASSISFEILETLCKIFDVTVEDILEYVPDVESDKD